jgi:hypothetical protein
MAVAGSLLFVADKGHIARMPLTCTAPCGAAETVVADGDINDMWVANESRVFWVQQSGILHVANKVGTSWQDQTVVQTGLTVGPVSIAATSDMLYVAALGTPTNQLFGTPLGGGEPMTFQAPPQADAAGEGMYVTTACDRVFVRTSSGRTFEVTPASSKFSPVQAAPGALYAAVADGHARYYGMANSGGLYRVTTGSGMGQQIAEQKSIWGLAVDERYVYYADHGRNTTPGHLYRRAKLY